MLETRDPLLSFDGLNVYVVIVHNIWWAYGNQSKSWKKPGKLEEAAVRMAGSQRVKVEVIDPVVLANFLSADGVSSPRPRPYVTTFTRIPWLHTQRGLPLYAVLSPHWIKVVGYKESFLLGLQQSRVTDRPVFQTKHSM